MQVFRSPGALPVTPCERCSSSAPPWTRPGTRSHPPLRSGNLPCTSSRRTESHGRELTLASNPQAGQLRAPPAGSHDSHASPRGEHQCTRCRRRTHSGSQPCIRAHQPRDEYHARSASSGTDAASPQLRASDQRPASSQLPATHGSLWRPSRRTSHAHQLPSPRSQQPGSGRPTGSGCGRPCTSFCRCGDSRTRHRGTRRHSRMACRAPLEGRFV